MTTCHLATASYLVKSVAWMIAAWSYASPLEEAACLIIDELFSTSTSGFRIPTGRETESHMIPTAT